MIPDGAPASPTAATPAVARALAVGAATIGLLRGIGLPMTSDDGFHLVRAGNSLLRGSLEAWIVPPGGTHAPPLGSLVAALAAALTTDPERKLTAAGCVLLAVATAGVVRVLVRESGVVVALLGAAFLLLPPGVAASFNHRPDAALGGLLLALAWERARRGEAAHRAAAPAWIAVLATPWALPAAVALQSAPGRPGRISPRALGVPASVAALLALLGAALPAGSRDEIVRYGLEAAAPGAAALRSSVVALRSVWAGGLLLAPLLLTMRRGPAHEPARFTGPFLGSFAAAFVLAAPGGFAAATAAFAPAVALALARIAARLAGSGASGSRWLAAAFLLPLLALLVGVGETEARRRTLRAAAVRNAQIGVALWREPDRSGSIAAEATGALAALSARAVHPLRDDGALPRPPPQWVVFADGRAPSTGREIATFEEPGFLATFAPRGIRRGETGAVSDIVWVRRTAPLEPAGPGYGRALRVAWAATAAGDTEQAEAALADAVGRAPSGPGFAHEALGVLRERAGDAARSRELLEMARVRDPACSVARVHLADRALSAGDPARADSLLAEAAEFAPASGVLPALRARLHAAAGREAEAERWSTVAVEADPGNGRILLNHGILLWRRGAHAEARALWSRAVGADPSQRQYLGRFEAAPDSAPAPPLRPVTTDVGFDPGTAPPPR